MVKLYRPEGGYLESAQNKEHLASPAALERAMNMGATVEGVVTLCDENMRLHVDLGCAEGIIEADEAIWCREGEKQKDIAVITRVGKAVACKITGLENRYGRLIARLSRKAAQRECMSEYLSHLSPGDLLAAKVTHLEPFGAFLDIGCGISSLLSVDCISVSRISHPRDRLRVGLELPVAVKYIHKEAERIYVTLKELLGTWEENAVSFEAGQTVTGVIRSVETYGVFVELAPNLAGLAEVREKEIEELRGRIGQSVAVYIKSIVPERMKIKLVLIDAASAQTLPPSPMRFFITPEKTPHLSRWQYSPPLCPKTVVTVFDE